MNKWSVAAAAAICGGWIHGAGVVWWSAPVEPGEIVQIHGGEWGKAPMVDFDGTKIKPLKVTESGLWFQYPKKSAAGLVPCRILSETGDSETFVLNEPDAWWVQGDLGEDASPGGWLRLFGRCLSRADGARVLLVPEKGRKVELTLSKKDVWSLDAELPKTLAEGRYTVYVSNGDGGKNGFRKVRTVTIRPYKEVWKEDVFDVTAFGAIANDGMDDSIALQAALEAAGKNGGGIVLLPRGRFQCNVGLVIPPYTLLRGVSKEESQLYWPDTEDPPETLIEGSHSFGIQDLFIHAGKYKQGIVCKNELAGKHELSSSIQELTHDITIRRVVFKLIIDQYLLRDYEEYGKRALTRGNGIVIRNGRFVRVEDCDIYCSKEGSSTLYFVITGDYVKMSGCRINGSGWAVVGGDKVIFEKNDAWNCTYSVSSVSKNLYWGQCRQYDLFTNNREAITHDGARVAFKDSAGAVCTDTKVKLIFEGKPQYREGAAFWKGYDLQIIEDRGAGQTRKVMEISADGTDLVIDRPWTIRPDETSRYVVAAERKHLLYVDNYTEDTSIAIQLYGGLTEGVLARNKSVRSGGFRGFGMVYHTIIPLWFVQYLDNEIPAGNSYRGPGNEIPSSDSVFEITDHGRQNLILTRSCLMRRNKALNNAGILVNSDNALVENCLVKNADTGIRGGKHAGSLVLAGNTFENVKEPISAEVADKALISAREVVLAKLAGTEAALGREIKGWAPVKAALKTDDADAAACFKQALAVLSAETAGKVLPGDVVDQLLGTTVWIKNWESSLQIAFNSQESKPFTVPMLISLAEQSPAKSCEIRVSPVEGWEFGSGSTVLLAGQTKYCPLACKSPVGPKGFFNLPVTATFAGEGWKLAGFYQPSILTEMRISPWLVAGPFDSPEAKVSAATGWKTDLNMATQGSILLKEALGAEVPAGKSVVAIAGLRAFRPTVIMVSNFWGMSVFLDDKPVGTSLGRGNFGALILAPGDHVLKIVRTIKAKDDNQRISMRLKMPESTKPGDFVILPPEETRKLLK